MSLPPLYKYLDIEGAKLTLKNRNFRHAKPSEFNDTKDMTIESVFPEDEEAALTKIVSNFARVVLRNIDRSPTCISLKRREQIGLIQATLKNTPVVKLMKYVNYNRSVSEYYDLDHVREYTRSFIKEINDFMRGYRIFCVSERKDSIKMWNVYTRNHQGIVLTVVPNLRKDSKFSLFRKVTYRERRPPFYDDAVSFLENSLFGNQDVIRNKSLEAIIYTKTLEWEYEKEYRLAIPIIGERDWSTMPYHPEEVVELYLGAKMNDDAKREVVDLARTLNPVIRIFQSYLTADDHVAFRSVG